MIIKNVFRAALVLVMAASCSLFTVGARAQGTMHMPLDKATISGDMAKKAAVKDQLSADLAQDIVNECVRIAKGSPNGTLSVYVLAPDGEILASHRMDGQNKINTVTGYKKAQTALWLRISTHQAANQFSTLDARLIRSSLDMYLVAGSADHCGRCNDRFDWCRRYGQHQGSRRDEYGRRGGGDSGFDQGAWSSAPAGSNQPADPLGQNARGGGGAGAGAVVRAVVAARVVEAALLGRWWRTRWTRRRWRRSTAVA